MLAAHSHKQPDGFIIYNMIAAATLCLTMPVLRMVCLFVSYGVYTALLGEGGYLIAQ